MKPPRAGFLKGRPSWLPAMFFPPPCPHLTPMHCFQWPAEWLREEKRKCCLILAASHTCVRLLFPGHA